MLVSKGYGRHLGGYDTKYRGLAFGASPPTWTAQGVTVTWTNTDAYNDWNTGVTGSMSPMWTGTTANLGLFASQLATAQAALPGSTTANTAIKLLNVIAQDVANVCTTQAWGAGTPNPITGRGAAGDAKYYAALTALDQAINQFNAAITSAANIDAQAAATASAAPGSTVTVANYNPYGVQAATNAGAVSLVAPAGPPPGSTPVATESALAASLGFSSDLPLYLIGGGAVIALYLLLRKKKPAQPVIA